MSDEKKYTERDLVLAKREGFEDGAAWQRIMGPRDNDRTTDRQHVTREAAAMEYPLPKVTRLREIADPHSGFPWRLRDGVFEWHDYMDSGEWRNDPWKATPQRVHVWATLCTRSTEEVEADA